MQPSPERKSCRIQRHAGFSIVELMIAMVLALVLMGGVVQVVTTSQSSYQELVQQARLQETARLAMDYIVRDLRNAGYMGCSASNLRVANTVEAEGGGGPVDVGFDPDRVLFGYDDGSPLSHYSGGLSFDDDADIIELRLIDLRNGSQRLQNQNSNSSANLKLTAEFSGEVGDIVTLVGKDCLYAAVFVVTPGSSTGEDVLNHNTGATGEGHKNCVQAIKGDFDCDDPDAISEPFQPGASVYRTEHLAYAVATTSDNPVSTLYRVRLDGSSEPLIENVVDLQFRYGRDTSGDGSIDRFATASSMSAADFADVLAVTLDMTVEAPEALQDGTRLTETFSSTVRLRNRGL